MVDSGSAENETEFDKSNEMTKTRVDEKQIYMGNCIERALMVLPLNQRMPFARSLAGVIVASCSGDEDKLEAAHQSLIHYMNEAERAVK